MTLSFKNLPVEAIHVFFDFQGSFHSIQQFFSFGKPHKSHSGPNYDLRGFWITTMLCRSTSVIWSSRMCRSTKIDKNWVMAILLNDNARPETIIFKLEEILQNTLGYTTACLIASNVVHASLKVCPHLYVNTNEACETEVNPNKCQKAVCSVFALLNIHSALRTLFFWSTDSKPIAFGCLPNFRRTNEWCLQRLGYTLTSTLLSFAYASFGICIQMWTRPYRNYGGHPKKKYRSPCSPLKVHRFAPKLELTFLHDYLACQGIYNNVLQSLLIPTW